LDGFEYYLFIYLVSFFVVPGVTPTTLGGVISIGAGGYFNVSSSSFTSAQGSCGGAFPIANVASIYITSSQFSANRALNGPGGALFFGENTGFSIQSFFSFFLFFIFYFFYC
jgi:hypothetical protein